MELENVLAAIEAAQRAAAAQQPRANALEAQRGLVRDPERYFILCLRYAIDAEYLTKPFSTPELKARVRALLRRASSHAATHETIINTGDLRMDLEARTLSRGRQLIHLTPIEWELLRVLMTRF